MTKFNDFPGHTVNFPCLESHHKYNSVNNTTYDKSIRLACLIKSIVKIQAAKIDFYLFCYSDA